MKRSLARRLTLVGVATLLSACGGSDRASSGAESSVASAGPDLSRVVCVSKQINEFIFALGAESHLVAVDLTSVYPPQIKELPTVGYHRALSAEGILSAKPTLFLTDGNVGPDEVLDQLRKVGIPIDIMKPGGSVEEAQRLMTDLGDLFGVRPVADSVVAVWNQEMADVRADSARFAAAPAPRVLIMHFGQLINNYLGLKSGGVAGRMLAWTHGVNAIDSIGGMSRLTPELIARLAPDVIIATEVGFDRLGSPEAFAQLPGVDLTPAAKNGRIYRIEEDKVMYFGPRTPAAVKEVGAMLHPELATPDR